MCWIGKRTDKCIITKEQSDRCFKLVKTDLTAIFHNFQYEIGKTYSIPELKPEPSFKDNIEIHEGFHFYKMDCSFHRPLPKAEVVILMCEIPEDAECYINMHNHGVTNKITIKKAIPYIECLRNKPIEIKSNKLIVK